MLPEPGEQYSAGENLTAHDFSENAFGHEGKGLSNDQFTDFVVGNSLFRTNWVTAPASVVTLDGLGPMMNASSCGACHFKDGRGEPGAAGTSVQNGLLIRLSIPGEGIHGEPLGDPGYGHQFQDRALLNVTPEGKLTINYTEVNGQYGDGTTYSLRQPVYNLTLEYGPMASDVMMSPRIAQQIPGLGLLENISDADILSHVDEFDKNGDGISGKANYVWDERSQSSKLGRFGWKANQPSIVQQVAGAMNGDIGITTTIFPATDLSDAQKEMYKDIPDGGNPELDDSRLDKITLYIQALSVPARRNYDQQDVLRGKMLFNQLLCSTCHTPKYVTSGSSSFSFLNNQTIRPYTDLLLHDMGAALADGRPDFKATGQEWRTPPLWGMGMVQTVNRHSTLLHDGRARNAAEAILWHGGEAETSKNNFKALPKNDREALIKFLESL